jgi:hypothetical protein
MATRLKSSKNREDNSMCSGIVPTDLADELLLELDYREPPEVMSDMWAQGGP